LTFSTDYGKLFSSTKETHMQRLRSFLIASLLLAGSSLAACDGNAPAPAADMALPVYLTVNGVLTRGCGTSGCHGAVGNTSMLRLGGTASENYATLTMGSGKAGKFIDKAAPGSSSLLLTPAMGPPAHPLPVWSAKDKDYQTVLNWLNTGATQD
jgi:hypothetical protein